MTSVGESVRRALEDRRDEALSAIDGLSAYLGLLLDANREINLVSRREASAETLVARHLVDSLEALPLLPARGAREYRLLDVGSGGGFPALPLLLVRRDVRGVLVESTGKKARFLETAIGALGLTARAVNARFPDPAFERMKDDVPCDILTSRAVAGAGEIVRQARPFLAPGAVGLLWTTAPLLDEVRRLLPGARITFVPSVGAERRGIARVERFT